MEDKTKYYINPLALELKRLFLSEEEAVVSA